jgi:hypothetical protein
MSLDPKKLIAQISEVKMSNIFQLVLDNEDFNTGFSTSLTAILTKIPQPSKTLGIYHLNLEGGPFQLKPDNDNYLTYDGLMEITDHFLRRLSKQVKNADILWANLHYSQINSHRGEGEHEVRALTPFHKTEGIDPLDFLKKEAGNLQERDLSAAMKQRYYFWNPKSLSTLKEAAQQGELFVPQWLIELKGKGSFRPDFQGIDRIYGRLNKVTAVRNFESRPISMMADNHELGIEALGGPSDTMLSARKVGYFMTSAARQVQGVFTTTFGDEAKNKRNYENLRTVVASLCIDARDLVDEAGSAATHEEFTRLKQNSLLMHRKDLVEGHKERVAKGKESLSHVDGLMVFYNSEIMAEMMSSPEYAESKRLNEYVISSMFEHAIYDGDLSKWKDGTSEWIDFNLTERNLMLQVLPKITRKMQKAVAEAQKKAFVDASPLSDEEAQRLTDATDVRSADLTRMGLIESPKYTMSESKKKEITDRLFNFHKMTNGTTKTLKMVGMSNKKKLRACASRRGFIALNNSDTSSTFYHEMTHHLEFSHKWVYEAGQAFLLDKIGKKFETKTMSSLEKQRHMKKRGITDASSVRIRTGYGRDEVAWNADVSNPYMGKEYSDNSSEVITMTMQDLLCEDEKSFKRFMEQRRDYPDEVAFAAGLLKQLQEGKKAA